MGIFRTTQHKNARELIRQARHLRNLRGDIIREADMMKLLEREEALESALRAGDEKITEQAIDDLYAHMNQIAPTRRQSAFSENFEILVVAVVVAMGFRTYFIQPFKIPTGSMEPTLNGIHVNAAAEKNFMDYIPLRYVKWLVTGQRYIEVRIQHDGYLGPRELSADEISAYYSVSKDPYQVTPGSPRYKLPKNAGPRFSSGDLVHRGDILWAGTETTGDHVFVDKLRWNFVKPKRGQVIVFSTKNIPTLPLGTHYIKRLIGLPGEEIRLIPPNILINGRIIDDSPQISRIERRQAPYNYGYVLAQRSQLNESICIESTNSVLSLTQAQYFACGDNTINSRDSRYWGSIPEENAIGPAVIVYWPISSRWGFIR